MKAARGARSPNPNIMILGGFRELNRHSADAEMSWVKSRHYGTSARCPLYPRKRTFRAVSVMCVLWHKGHSALLPLDLGVAPPQSYVISLSAPFDVGQNLCDPA